MLMPNDTKPKVAQKYLDVFLTFLPLILLVLFIYLSNTVPAFAYVEWALVISGIGYMVFIYFNSQRLSKNLTDRHNLPKIYTNFPVYETSEEEYRLIRKKMETFILSVEADRSAQVELNSNEINSLYKKGKNISDSETKFIFSLPNFYEIRDGKIYKYSIGFFPFSWTGFLSNIHEIEFLEQNGNYFTTQKIIEHNGKKISPKKQSLVSQPLGGDLIDTLLRLDKTMEWSDSMKLVISKIRHIEISQDKLILRA